MVEERYAVPRAAEECETIGMRKPPNSVVYKLEKWFREIIIAMMKRDGRDFTFCEVGKHRIKGRFDLHHMKYEGATYYDLQVSCRKCNTAPENVGLA